MKSQVQIAAALIGTVLLAVLLSVGINHYTNLRAAAAQGKVDKEKLGTTTAVIADSDKSDTDRQRVDVVVSDGRGTFQTNQQEAKRNEPTTRARADSPVPASVRKNYRERRLARERLGRDAVGDEEGTRAQDAPER